MHVLHALLLLLLLLLLLTIPTTPCPLLCPAQATYVILFALLLTLHEVNEVRPLSQVEDLLRRNFGFLFKPFGKGCFIIFIAFLNFGLTVNTRLGMATGICLSVVGAGYILLYLRNPEVFERGNQKAPQASYTAPPNPGPGV